MKLQNQLVFATISTAPVSKLAYEAVSLKTDNGLKTPVYKPFELFYYQQ